MSSRLELAKPHILELFQGADKHVYSTRQLQSLISIKCVEWDLPKWITMGSVFEFLLSETQLREITLRCEPYRAEKRYVWGRASVYEIAASLRRGAYLSHGTAVFLHDLTDRIPKTIYVNHEQSPKPPPSGGLTQQRIDLAFARPQRMSKYEFRLDQHRILLLNGKNTKRLGVETLKGTEGENLAATNVERTLIDIVVRPAYAGGILQVLEAFETARERVSAERLVATLEAVDFLYPYHQAIGFLMERAGYEEQLCARLRARGVEFDFYLVHGMKKKQYHKTWRLFYPEGF